MDKITIIKPDDCHIHLRDQLYLKSTVADAAERFARAVVMPNLKPPIVTVDQAKAYHDRIVAAVPKHLSFQPLMTLYLCQETTPDIIKTAKESNLIVGVKYYPAHGTTHSEMGIHDITSIFPILSALEKYDLPLLLHGESTKINVDIFEREKYFIDDHLTQIIAHFPNLRIVLEHISTKEAVSFVEEAPKNVAATITPHHLLLNRNDLLAGGLRPHYYCMPIVKTREDQHALLKAATSGNPKFFLGTDSAPHSIDKKECDCGAAGIYSAHAAVEIYFQLFEQHNAINHFENFASRFGSAFYGLPLNKEKLTLVRETQAIPKQIIFGDELLVPLFANQTIHWKIQHDNP